MIDLPEGYQARPLRYQDAAAVVAVMSAQQRRDLGEVAIELADIEADWQRPSFDLAASTVGVFTADRLVAYAEVGDGARGDASVHPEHEGRGIGTALAHWMQTRARDLGREWIGMPVPRDSAADRLLASLGYVVRWESWVLTLPAGREVAARPLPAGYAVRAAEPAEYPACWTLNEDAFLEWSVRERQPYEDWLATTVRRPGFEPWQLRVVVDAAEEVVGLALVLLAGTDEGTEGSEGPEGYVDRLATRSDQRGRGLAQALLADAFTLARARGAVRCALDTDSRTGALGLYEKVGMTVTSTWRHRGVRLTG